MRSISVTTLVFLLLLVSSCADEKKISHRNQLFERLSEERTNITFVNQLDYTESVNTYTFKNFYNGGGVGLADFNNDSLLDVFFTGNLVSNRLYLNKGNLTFEDITDSAGLNSAGTWSTGVSIVDLNADGLLDIYVCKSGPPGGERRHNELFINNGDLTFTEQSKEYGLDFVGLSTHAAFFDYDNDNDLDCYLLNNSIRSIGAYDLRKDQRNTPDPAGGNKLLRNDAGKFVDVTIPAGIYSSMIGFGLGVTIGDINADSWPDIYVSNDFFEKDYLYLNRGDGTFKESLEEMIEEISLGSMGADLADVNNDGLPEIFVTEMLPESDDRLKTTTQFENWNKYVNNIQQGYFRQFSRNVLQLNNGNGTFSEIGRLAGVHATDWSWGALITDVDNDGLKDIFVANGIYKDLLNQDYVNFVSNRNFVRDMLRQEGQVIKRLIDSIPVNKIPNFLFHNRGDLRFEDKASEWGIGEPTHSNGSAYGDLDNDGDLDLVLNNVNMPAHVYENHSREVYPENAYLSVVLKGSGTNTFAFGSSVTVYSDGNMFYQEHFPSRGFMSSVDYKLTFGVGKSTLIDSVVVRWPDDRMSVITKVLPNQILYLAQRDGVHSQERRARAPSPIFKKRSVAGVDFKHKESSFVDFDRDKLLFNMISNEGPCLCVGDINDDNLQDFYVGGAKNHPGSLYVQQSDHTFRHSTQKGFEADSTSEDTACVFFDADKDGRQDLYIASGSNEYSGSSTALIDRLWFNRGDQRFEKSKQLLPVSTRFESTSTVKQADFDADGDLDLFVGVRVIPGLYGVACNGYLLENDGKGNFRDVTAEKANALINLGMITDALWVDVNNDSWQDLIIVGEWMSVQLFINKSGRLSKVDSAFENSAGWYHSVAVGDFNEDGLMDVITGNHGLNSQFKASKHEPLQLYINDFDQNGSVEHVTTRYYNGQSLPLVLRQDLVTQIPSLKKKYLLYDRYKGQTITDIFSRAELRNSIMLTADHLETSLWLNSGDGSFRKSTLPVSAQFSPVYEIYVDDYDGDSHLDILLGGNLSRAKPETGAYHGSHGTVLRGDGKGNFVALSPSVSGISIDGEIRGIQRISNNPKMLVVARNNDELEFLVID